jgi:hypothetical protein
MIVKMESALMHPDIQSKFATYPEHVRPAMLYLRSLICSVAEEHQLGNIEETLSWGEPSYQVKLGSAVRMDWKPKDPNHYFIFFHCQTKLVDTFRELYRDTLAFQGKRAIVLALNRELPEDIIRHCLKMAFTYKNPKYLPLLGM